MLTPLRSLLSAVLIIALAACSGGASNGSSPSSPAPTATPDFGAIDHPTGPTDVVLRFEEGGGFVMASFRATEAPIFTLYGDGTIIVRNPTAEPLNPIGSVYPMRPFRTARLTEAQIQDVLANALGEGGLGVARPNYGNDLIADAPTAKFTINAGGVSKTVSIYALGLELDGGPDALARGAFAGLASRLGNIDNDGNFATSEFTPERYRGVLLEGQPGAPGARPWPWTDIAPAAFVPGPDPNGLQLPARIMSVADVETLGIDPYQGGFQGLTLSGPGDGRHYSFALRPLLPDESE